MKQLLNASLVLTLFVLIGMTFAQFYLATQTEIMVDKLYHNSLAILNVLLVLVIQLSLRTTR